MTVHSGLFAVIDGISTMRNWQLSDELNNPSYVASNTRAGTDRQTGVGSWNGSFNCFGASPLVMPGNFYDFLGYTAPDDDAEGSTGNVCSGSIIVDSVALTFNFQTAEVISHVVNFSGHLDLSWLTGQTAIYDETDVDAPSICGLHIDYSSNGSDFSVLSDITTATLTITAKNTQYVNSSTNCTTGRQRGPIDWSAAIQRQDNTKRLTKGANYVWRWYVDNTNYWLLKWGKIKSFTGLSVNRETAEIIAHTLNVEMKGYNNGIGQIRLPGAGSDFWPAA